MKRFLLLLTSLLFLSAPAQARSPFEGGWTLQPADSSLHFTSVKKGSVAETSHFDTVEGQIDPTGLVHLKVKLESVDTGIDIRNVRMRFLFFETFTHPFAEIVAQVRDEDIAGLAVGQSRALVLPILLTLHGVTAEVDAHVRVSLLSDRDVTIHTTRPLFVPADSFDLLTGLRKLEEAAEAQIVPLGMVSTHLHFRREAGPATTVAVAKPFAVSAPAAQTTRPKPPVATPASATAQETPGLPGPDLSSATSGGCLGGLVQMAKSTRVSFADGGARLTPAGISALDQLAVSLFQCPAALLEIGGHTDSTGGAASNKRLSQRRADRVASYLFEQGIPEHRIAAIGYGEAFPLLPNTTDENRAQNRRITLRVLN
ncbi:OmpA family protein [Epibacterium ulvae]|uniref:OmpA family protein n=1 Tax=Epibacterium ulvae TaxID=1156985 RepID=UPI001BFC4D01|nr:OmpA family protein [Epibacterium ulvae]MBT8153157.1 OmpA family protein [Epibacterium ulvae]